LIFFIPTLHAQQKPLPDPPKPNKKVFVAGVSLLAAAKTADAITTRQLLDGGGWENDPVFGRYPSPAKQAGINLAFFAASPHCSTSPNTVAMRGSAGPAVPS
jgi:hypothetical protein